MYWMRVFVQKILDDACTLESCSSFYFYSGFLSIFFFWGGGISCLAVFWKEFQQKYYSLQVMHAQQYRTFKLLSSKTVLIVYSVLLQLSCNPVQIILPVSPGLVPQKNSIVSLCNSNQSLSCLLKRVENQSFSRVGQTDLTIQQSMSSWLFPDTFFMEIGRNTSMMKAIHHPHAARPGNQIHVAYYYFFFFCIVH